MSFKRTRTRNKNKKILLIDADSKIPNLVLMKLSNYYKKQGACVTLQKLNINYYPSKPNKLHIINSTLYDKVFCSVIFDNSIKYIRDIRDIRDVLEITNTSKIVFGGTGFDLKTKLPNYIEKLQPDYSLYSKQEVNNTSYGFISRGCIRNCFFCKVPQKEGKIKQVNKIKDIIKHDKVKFLDNNFLALPNHIFLLKELIQLNIKCQFNQGLDVRLINKNNSILLSKLNYIGEYLFAFDDIKYKKIIKNKLELMKWRKNWGFKFFIYIHPDMKIIDTVKRIRFLKRNKCLPYIMRDISCYSDKRNKFYTDLCAWCNQPGFFKKMGFLEFLKKRHKKLNRINYSINLYYKEI